MNTDYPRPDFQRTKLCWRSLDGTWQFLFDDQNEGVQQRWHLNGLPNIWRQYLKRAIVVPYTFQCSASGVNDQTPHAVVWYEQDVDAFNIERGTRLLLRCGAIDYEADVWINGHHVGFHRGGHTPFELDITDEANGTDFRITIRVFDSPTDKSQPRGKQYWGPKPENIFYTPSTGVWQSVWLEAVPYKRIADASHGTSIRADNVETGDMDCEVCVIGPSNGHSIKISASLAGHYIGSILSNIGADAVSRASLSLRSTIAEEATLHSSLQKLHDSSIHSCWRNGLALWSPEHPVLYDISIRLLDEVGGLIDEVHTTTGIRSIDYSRMDGVFRLNGHPMFQALVLDQGYWPQTGMTPPSSEALKQDILLAKAMGFNGCRKHQKLEDPRFLYWADRLGFLVWSEMANAYEYSDRYVERFNQEWTEAVKRDRNHPCIIAWTPVNETWGYPDLSSSSTQQNHIRTLYFLTKTLDPTRPVNDNCGWEHVCTDLTTFHDYSDSKALAVTCATLDGILAPKANHAMFVEAAEHKKVRLSSAQSLGESILHDSTAKTKSMAHGATPQLRMRTISVSG